VEVPRSEQLHVLKQDTLRLSQEILRFVDDRRRDAPKEPPPQTFVEWTFYRQKLPVYLRGTMESYNRRLAPKLKLLSERLESAGYLNGKLKAYAIEPPVKLDDLEDIYAQLGIVGEEMP